MPRKLLVAALASALFISGAIADEWHKLGTAPFSPRDTADTHIFHGKLYISNGWYHGGVHTRDLWSSKNGVDWKLVNGSTPYDTYAGLASLGDVLYAVKLTSWKSLDGGKSWVKVADKTPITDNRTVSFLFQMKGKLYLLGTGLWSSTDGVTWTEEPRSDFFPRNQYVAAVSDDAIYVAAGGTEEQSNPPEKGYPKLSSHNDVWKFDGKKWTQITPSAPWSPRFWPALAAIGDRLILFGGYDNKGAKNLGGTWVSDDEGATWHRLSFDLSPSARHYPSLWVQGDDVLMAAGNAWPVQNDIWRLDLD